MTDPRIVDAVDPDLAAPADEPTAEHYAASHRSADRSPTMTADRTLADVIDNLDRMEAERAARLERARLEAAELAVLFLFDGARRFAGHDYGNGQRHRELRRRERELEAVDQGIASLATVAAYPSTAEVLGRSLERDGLELLTADELRAGFERIGRPRIARLEREAYRAGTPASRRTLEAWQRVERAVAAR